MSPTHLEEYAIVNDGEVGVPELGAHHSKPVGVGSWLKRVIGSCYDNWYSKSNHADHQKEPMRC